MTTTAVTLTDGRVVTLTDEGSRLDREELWRVLSTEVYWGTWRTRADVDAQFDHAWRVVSAHVDGRMVGFGRAFSDGVAQAYLADVYIDPSLRGHGLGTALTHFMIADGPGAGFRWMLHTRDAHDLYRRFGFDAPTDRFMERPGAHDAPTTR